MACGHPGHEATRQTGVARVPAELRLPLFKQRNVVGVCRESSYSIFFGGGSWFAYQCGPSKPVSASHYSRPGETRQEQLLKTSLKTRFRTRLKPPRGGFKCCLNNVRNPP